MRYGLRIGLIGILWLGIQWLATAQVPELSSEARISLITIFPGDALYSAFGHSALRVYDPVLGIDYSYNYGTFNFEEEGFYLNFIRGNLNYFLSKTSFPRVFAWYTEVEKRSVVEQVLAFTPEEKQKLFEYLEWNYLPQHRYYRYDFFYDNCSTRIRDALEYVLEQQPAYRLSEDTRSSFRALIAPYLRARPLVHAGIDLVLGQPADRIASTREQLFLPLKLMDAVAHTTARDKRLLVSRTDTLFWNAEASYMRSVPQWPTLLMWGIFIWVLTQVVLHWMRGEGGRLMRVDLFWLGGAGIVGWVLLGLWVGTSHEVAAKNWNLLWAWPSHVLVMIYLWRTAAKKNARWVQIYLTAVFFVSILTLLSWSIIPQRLPDIAFPWISLMALRAGWLRWGDYYKDSIPAVRVND